MNKDCKFIDVYIYPIILSNSSFYPNLKKYLQWWLIGWVYFLNVKLYSSIHLRSHHGWYLWNVSLIETPISSYHSNNLSQRTFPTLIHSVYEAMICSRGNNYLTSNMFEMQQTWPWKHISNIINSKHTIKVWLNNLLE